jgi:hypothetical protein
MKVKITSTRFDIGEDEISRIGRLALVWKIIPFGDQGGGPGWKCVVLLFIFHILGRPFWLVATRYEDRLKRIYRRLQKIKYRSLG